jgi:hypothetical protein
VIEPRGLDTDEHLACPQRSHFLDANLDDLRPAGTERASNPPMSNRAHLDNHTTDPVGAHYQAYAVEKSGLERIRE